MLSSWGVGVWRELSWPQLELAGALSAARPWCPPLPCASCSFSCVTESSVTARFLALDETPPNFLWLTFRWPPPQGPSSSVPFSSNHPRVSGVAPLQPPSFALHHGPVCGLSFSTCPSHHPFLSAATLQSWRGPRGHQGALGLGSHPGHTRRTWGR